MHAIAVHGGAGDIPAAELTPQREAEYRSGLEQAGLNQERRALRLRPGALNWRWIEAAEGVALELDFVLPAGAYATVVLAELGEISTLVRP